LNTAAKPNLNLSFPLPDFAVCTIAGSVFARLLGLRRQVLGKEK